MDAVPLSLSTDGETSEPRSDPSYDLCLAGWAKWLADTGALTAPSARSAEEVAELREAIVVQLVAALGPSRTDGAPTSKA